MALPLQHVSSSLICLSILIAGQGRKESVNIVVVMNEFFWDVLY